MGISWQRTKTITEFVPEDAGTYLMPQAHGSPLQVRVRFISHALDHHWDDARPVLCIEIESDTTLANIKKSWAELLNLRQELNEARGPWDREGGGAETFYLWCWENHHNKHTWNEIASEVNRSIKQHLLRPNPRYPDHARTLLQWANGAAGDLHPDDVLDNYPVTGDELRVRVRNWHRRYSKAGQK